MKKILINVYLISLLFIMLLVSCKKNEAIEKNNEKVLTDSNEVKKDDAVSNNLKYSINILKDNTESSDVFTIQLISEDKVSGEKTVIRDYQNCNFYIMNDFRCIFQRKFESVIRMFNLENGEYKELCSCSESDFTVTDNLRYICKIDRKETPYSFSVFDVESKNVVFHEDLEKLFKNLSRFSRGSNDKTIEKNDNFITISYFDDWGEKFEEFVFDTDDFSITRKDIAYSKMVNEEDIERINELKENLPSLK